MSRNRASIGASARASARARTLTRRRGGFVREALWR